MLCSEDFDERREHLLRIISPIHIKESIESLSKRMWIVAKNETNYKFYTSDNPIVRHIHRERGASAYEIFFPLTPTIGLILLNKEDFIDLSMFNNKIMILNKKEFVKWYNEQQIYFAGRHVFNIENDFRFARRVTKLAN